MDKLKAQRLVKILRQSIPKTSAMVKKDNIDGTVQFQGFK